MEIEDQVVSLELAKKLKEIGIKQDSIFYYAGDSDKNGKYVVTLRTRPFVNYLCNSYGEISYYSAFTASELINMIPENWCNFYKTPDGYVFSINGSHNVVERNLSNCAAKMIILLTENGSMPV